MAFLTGAIWRNQVLGVGVGCVLVALCQPAIAHFPEQLIAHTIQTNNNVAATFHLEPNHNPKAGEDSLVWFVLTQPGGEQIPLADCDCRLKVYAEPFKPGDFSLLEPKLAAINAEKYQAIPGAKLVFPKSGRYSLELTGKSRDGVAFKPFQLRYSVTVTAGKSAPVTKIEPAPNSSALPNVKPEAATESDPEPWMFGMAVIFGFGIASALMLKPKK